MRSVLVWCATNYDDPFQTTTSYSIATATCCGVFFLCSIVCFGFCHQQNNFISGPSPPTIKAKLLTAISILPLFPLCNDLMHVLYRCICTLSGLKLPNTGFRFNYFMQRALEGLFVDILWVQVGYITIDTRTKYTNKVWFPKRYICLYILCL